MDNKILKRSELLFSIIVLLISVILSGCSGNKTVSSGTPSSNENPALKAEVKSKPDTLTKVKVALPTVALQYWPWYTAEKLGIFKKYNLDVEFVRVESGVVALRGIQSGDFEFVTSNAESVITGVSEGAQAKLIGALTAQSIETVYVSPEIQSVNDLKGKAAASFQPGNGVDFQLRYWLDKNGIKPDKDIRILSSGGTRERFTAVKSGVAQVTIVVPPFNFEAEAAGLKKIGEVKDVLKTYNHDVIIGNVTVLSKKPELARALMAATAEAMDFVKNSANKSKLIEIGMEKTGSSEEIVTKSWDYLMPSFADKGKLVEEGVMISVNSLKEVGVLKKDVTIKELYDDSFYPKK